MSEPTTYVIDLDALRAAVERPGVELNLRALARDLGMKRFPASNRRASADATYKVARYLGVDPDEFATPYVPKPVKAGPGRTKGGRNVAVPTKVRIPDDLRERYTALAKARGVRGEELVIEVLRSLAAYADKIAQEGVGK
jgi:hypothetical protein